MSRSVCNYVIVRSAALPLLPSFDLPWKESQISVRNSNSPADDKVSPARFVLSFLIDKRSPICIVHSPRKDNSSPLQDGNSLAGDKISPAHFALSPFFLVNFAEGIRHPLGVIMALLHTLSYIQRTLLILPRGMN